MSRGAGDNAPLPEGWELEIPESFWPDAMLSALRADLRALSAPRVITTLRSWQQQARNVEDLDAQRLARRRLLAVTAAILDEQDSVLGQVALAPEDFADPNGSGSDREALTMDGVPVPAPSKEGTELGRLTSGLQEQPRAGSRERLTSNLPDIRRIASRIDSVSRVLSLQQEPPSHRDSSEAGPDRLGQPKPGVIRRHFRGPRRPSIRPRAALPQIRILYPTLMPLCQELVPLPVERRSRRFWARWQEIALGRGVRREFIETLLRTATDARELVTEMIAEICNVDAVSVRQLIDRIDPEVEDSRTRPTQDGPLRE